MCINSQVYTGVNSSMISVLIHIYFMLISVQEINPSLAQVVDEFKGAMAAEWLSPYRLAFIPKAPHCCWFQPQ